MGAAPTGPSISVGDIYYTLFRHKWKIVLCSIAGFLAAGASYVMLPPLAESRAKLFIRYITDSKAVVSAQDDSNTKLLDQSGDSILNSELEILTSFDLAQQAAATIGPEKILKKPGTGNDLFNAAVTIKKSLLVEIPPRTSVISVTFRHWNPAIVQPALQEIIALYLEKHKEIHQSKGLADNFLIQETDKLRTRLSQTEEALRSAKNKAGVISIDDSKKSYSDQISKIRQDILSAEAELAERSSVFNELTNKQSAEKTTSERTDPSPDQVNQFKNLVIRQEGLQKRLQDMLSYIRGDNVRVKEVQAQLAEVEQQKKKLTDDFPQLVRLNTATTTTGASAATTFDPVAEGARLTALQAKIRVLTTQLDGIGQEAVKVDQMEGTISELRRMKELEETNYTYYSASLEHARIADALGGSGGVSNISQIQTPSPAYIDLGKSVKIMAGIVIAGVAAGFAWAFLIEMFLDRSVRRPADLERMLRLPLFLSIPKLSAKELRQGAASSSIGLPAPKEDPVKDSKLAVSGKPGTELAPWDREHALHPFHETLRDRLINYFESVNLTHKPKLVAVTGLGHGGGVTTTAAGLASSLSETGDGNVLLVDMTQGQGSAQQFYQGKAVCGLEEILDTRDNAQIEQNLFVVGQEPGGEKLSRILPQRFNKLVPKLKASNFDYIIFDMPPVNQISITPRLAGFMDMVLLVVESEKTDRDLVQRATALLAESKVHVGAVLNKNKTYVPPMLHQDNLGNG